MRRIALTAVTVGLMGAALIAQEARPRFEVASVRPQTPTFRLANVATTLPRIYPGGTFRGTHSNVLSLIMFAYDLKEYQIIGGPDWVRHEYFDINAKTKTPDPAVEDIRLMVQSLLEDRFGLVVHNEQRNMRFQALVRARANRDMGPNLLPIDECNSAFVNDLRRKSPEKYPTPLGGGLTSGCSSPGLHRFAEMLSFGLKTPVVDDTGLTGSFYFILRSEFSSIVFGTANKDPDLPSLPTALDEQLGVKLESRVGPFQFLVIDSVQQPTEN